MRGWLAAGNEIVGLWMPVMPNKGLVHRDRRLAWLAPRLSTAAIVKRNKIPVRVVPRLGTWAERMEAIEKTGADTLICLYFPFLVPEDMLAHFGNRAVNLHPSPLPRYRGPTPMEAMILDGSILTEATITMHLMVHDLDAGDVIASRPLRFPADGNREKYRLEQARNARWLVQKSLPDYLAGSISPVPQEIANTTYCKVYRTDLALNGSLDWQAIEWRCRTLAQHLPLDIDGIDSARIVGFSGILGPASGTPPVLKRFHIDMDCADARVRLKRKRPWTSLIRKAVTLLVQINNRDQV